MIRNGVPVPTLKFDFKVGIMLGKGGGEEVNLCSEEKGHHCPVKVETAQQSGLD